MVIYEAESSGTVYELEPTTNNTTTETGVFRVINYYDSNTNTLVRTYASSSANELPLVGVATSTSMGVPSHTSSYKDLYGGIPATVANRPTIKLSTGLINAPGGITISGTATAPTAAAGTNNTTIATTAFV